MPGSTRCYCLDLRSTLVKFWLCRAHMLSAHMFELCGMVYTKPATVGFTADWGCLVLQSVVLFLSSRGGDACCCCLQLLDSLKLLGPYGFLYTVSHWSRIFYDCYTLLLFCMGWCWAHMAASTLLAKFSAQMFMSLVRWIICSICIIIGCLFLF